MSNFKLVERDYIVFREIEHWQTITGKQREQEPDEDTDSE